MIINFPFNRITKPIWYLKLKNADKTVWLNFCISLITNGLAAFIIWFMVQKISL